MALVRPRSAFVPHGSNQVFGPADILNDDDPVVRAHPDCFEPVRATVEQATAAPGEKRAVTRTKQ